MFPKSDDVRWYKMDKYKTGQQGIWLLHKALDTGARAFRPRSSKSLPTVGERPDSASTRRTTCRWRSWSA